MRLAIHAVTCTTLTNYLAVQLVMVLSYQDLFETWSACLWCRTYQKYEWYVQQSCHNMANWHIVYCMQDVNILLYCNTDVVILNQ